MSDVESSTRIARLTVTEVIDESHDARSLVFAVPDEHRDHFGYRPGQFLTLRIPSERTGSVARCYSLASSPHTDDAHKVTVKRTDGGYGSNWLCDNVSVGSTIESLPPSGVFTPASLDDDFLLWAAGSGITPVMSILKSVLSAGSGRVILCYANRDERSVIFAAELRELAARHAGRLTVLHWLESVQGLPTRAQLCGFAQLFSGYESFICGPEPFMAVVRAALTEAGFRADASTLRCSNPCRETRSPKTSQPRGQPAPEPMPALPKPRSNSTERCTNFVGRVTAIWSTPCWPQVSRCRTHAVRAAADHARRPCWTARSNAATPRFSMRRTSRTGSSWPVRRVRCRTG